MSTQTLEHSADGASSHAHDAEHGHVTTPILLLSVYGILLVLTVATVAITLVDLGDLNVWIALLIAVAKASVVALYFMHLRWDSPFNAAIFILSLLFVMFFIGLTILDTHSYRPNMVMPGPGQVP